MVRLPRESSFFGLVMADQNGAGAAYRLYAAFRCCAFCPDIGTPSSIDSGMHSWVKLCRFLLFLCWRARVRLHGKIVRRNEISNSPRAANPPLPPRTRLAALAEFWDGGKGKRGNAGGCRYLLVTGKAAYISGRRTAAGVLSDGLISRRSQCRTECHRPQAPVSFAVPAPANRVF